MGNNLYITKCKRCGKEITTMFKPIYTSNETMQKYQGICSSCMSETEYTQMLFSMNNDISNRFTARA